MDEARAAELDLEQNATFQVRDWRFQRVGWALMLLVVGAALTGVFGRGPLARGHLASADGSATLAYDRIGRNLAPSTLELDVQHVPADGKLRVWIDAEYLRGLKLASVVPEPEAMTSAGARVWLTMAATAPAHVLIHYDAQVPFLRHGALGIEGGPTFTFRQFIQP